MRFEAEALRLQGNRAAPTKRIENGRRVVTGGPHDLRPRPAKDVLVVGVLPLHQILQDVEETVALDLRLLLGQVVGGIVYQRGKEDRPTGGKGTARPPQVKGRWMAVADGLLARGLLVDGVQRKRYLYELLAVGQEINSFIFEMRTRSLAARKAP